MKFFFSRYPETTGKIIEVDDRPTFLIT